MNPVRPLAVVALALALPTVLAGGSNAVRLAPASWKESVCVRAYDPDAGAPQRILLEFQRAVAARARVENVAASPAEAAFTYAVSFRLMLPDGQPLAERSRAGTEQGSLAGFDGTVDFGGGSGRVLGWRGTDTETLVIDDPAMIALFAGAPGAGGSIELPVTAAGDSHLAATEDLVREIDLRAGVRVRLQYVWGP